MEYKTEKTDYILEGYRDLLSLTRQMLLISESMRGFVHNAQIERIEKELRKRNEILTEIKSIEGRLLPHRKGRLWKQMHPHERNNIQSLARGIRETIQKVQALDRETRTLLNDDKEKVAGMLKKISYGHRLIKGYTAFQMGKPRYLSLAA